MCEQRRLSALGWVAWSGAHLGWPSWPLLVPVGHKTLQIFKRKVESPKTEKIGPVRPGFVPFVPRWHRLAPVGFGYPHLRPPGIASDGPGWHHIALEGTE